MECIDRVDAAPSRLPAAGRDGAVQIKIDSRFRGNDRKNEKKTSRKKIKKT